MRSAFRGFGIALIVWGVLLFLNVPSFTGFASFDGLTGRVASLLGLIFVVVGCIFVVASRAVPGKLEQTVASASPAQKVPRIFISRIALERAEKDDYINKNWNDYLKEIQMIQGDPRSRPQERIGEFSVSPRGHKMIRVAWHYDPQTNSIYIDDVLYHKGDLRYNEGWNKRATSSHITRRTYAEKGYQPLEVSH